ncbi:MAG: thiamine diphosphokinase [Candidatus Riflebacteria bacterium]|nr:thiamine diphosphokinase [Candidatus Riflebacteria bacterium]
MVIDPEQMIPRPHVCNLKAVVFLNGEFDLPSDYFKVTKDYDIFDFFCADGGANLAVKLGIIPQLVIGDMDSISIQTRRKLEKRSQFIELPADKDISDAEALLDLLNSQGYSEIHIFAATGGRLDQTIFNLQLLQKFAQARIITRNEEISFLEKSSCISDKTGCRASLIPLSGSVTGLTLTGFQYNLKNCVIKSGSTLTLSNVIISDSATVSYQKGALLLITERVAPVSEKLRRGLHIIK